MAKIEFDIANNKLIVTSTDKPYNDGVGEAFKVDLLNADGSIAKSSTINKNGNAENFKNTLNGADF